MLAFLLENDPDATMPIAGAFMLAPLVMLFLTPLPTIGINAHAVLRLEVVSALEMPALPSALHAIPADALVAARANPHAPNKMAFAIGCMLSSLVLRADGW